jgi:hypothetical protein
VLARLVDALSACANSAPRTGSITPTSAAVHDLGQTPEGTLDIAMELVDGPTLKDGDRAGPPHATVANE